jgi:lipopolysaccharide export system permease protein
MKIIHSYILKQHITNVFYSLIVLVLLFLTVDFIDRIDNILQEGAGLSLTLQYFLLKIPFFLTLVIPASMLIATMFTIGLLSKNSELTAMRASGLTLLWLIRPILLIGVLASGISFVVDQTIVPKTTRRVKEIYNIDIRKKDKKGGYNQNDFWWREQDGFYSVQEFDSRDNSLHELTEFKISDNFEVLRRLDAKRADFIGQNLGWSLFSVKDYQFSRKFESPVVDSFPNYPLLIKKTPRDFYDFETDPSIMSYAELRRFMKLQSTNGLPTSHYLADLYDKISFPLASFIVSFVIIPLSIRSARSGKIAGSILLSLILGFSFYALHSFSIALGRAEIIPPLLAAWFTNAFFFALGSILIVGAEKG